MKAEEENKRSRGLGCTLHCPRASNDECASSLGRPAKGKRKKETEKTKITKAKRCGMANLIFHYFFLFLSPSLFFVLVPFLWLPIYASVDPFIPPPPKKQLKNM